MHKQKKLAAMKAEDQQEHPGTGTSKDTIFFKMRKRKIFQAHEKLMEMKTR